MSSSSLKEFLPYLVVRFLSSLMFHRSSVLYRFYLLFLEFFKDLFFIFGIYRIP